MTPTKQTESDTAPVKRPTRKRRVPKKLTDETTPQALAVVLAEGEEAVAKALSEMLDGEDIAGAHAYATVIVLTAAGRLWNDIEAKTKVPWQKVSRLSSRLPLFQKLYAAARAAGDEVRIMVRDEEMHRRAVDGWDEPVFVRTRAGIEERTVRRFSDRLLETLHKEDHPEKYPVKGGESIVNVQVNALMAALAGSGLASTIKPQSATYGRPIAQTPHNGEIPLQNGST